MSDETKNDGFAYERECAVSDKSKVVAALLCFFLGGIGAHRFYLGHKKSGAVMLAIWVILVVSVGMGKYDVLVLSPIVPVWSLIDFFRILFNKMTDAQGRKL